MSSVFVIDSQTAGISGDMLLAALIDAGANRQTIQNILERIPSHYPRCKSLTLETKEVRTHGFRACGVFFNIIEDSHETEARDLLRAAETIATSSQLSDAATSLAVNSIRTLIEAESTLHGVDLASTHLHEAGSTDTLADVFGVAAACDSMNVFEGTVFATRVAVGSGTMSFSHGTVSIPAPAVLEIARLHHIPLVGGPEAIELATPTGLAILANLAQRFVDAVPALTPEKVGYGAGKIQLMSTPNIMRVIEGRRPENLRCETVQILETNLDDVTGEILAHALLALVDAGAKDAWTTPAQFKKNRPGNVLHVICGRDDTERMSKIIMEETGTLGVRFAQWRRLVLERETRTLNVEIKGKKFEVRVKIARDTTGRIIRVKPEFEDLSHIAKETELAARTVHQLVATEAARVYQAA